MAAFRWIQDYPRELEDAFWLSLKAVKWFAPLLRRFGYKTMDRLFYLPEKISKRAIFDCRMCGQCVLHSTGMTCPMTCPKYIRNGPCGGVRPDGGCEIIPDMMCVWLEAYERSEIMPIFGKEILLIQPPMNYMLKGTSSWINYLSGEDKKLPSGWVVTSQIYDSQVIEP